MITLLTTLKSRNAVLYGFGLICLLSAGICLILTGITTAEVLSINAFIKPTKFFVSTGIFCWTMGWFTILLPQRRQILIYSWATVFIMVFELSVIAVQATRGKLSHFNVSSPADGILFALMGLAIAVFTGWTAYVGYLFFRIRPAGTSTTYLWGIRLGILIFVFFAFEGFLMAAQLGHTVGAPDGGPGMPGTNWSTRYGDLRVAHFFGMHALQLIPLFGYYLARRPSQVILVAISYFFLVSVVLLQALAGKPLLAGLLY